MTTRAVARRRQRGMYPKRTDVQQKPEGKRLPEFLDKNEIDAIIRLAEPVEATLIMEIGFRAGLRISETLALAVSDISLDSEYPTLKVRKGKGNKVRIVPIHPELGAALSNYLIYRPGRSRKLFDVTRSTAHRWIKRVVANAESVGVIPKGKVVSSHTFRHSAARHWLMSGVPVNVVQVWLGHSSLSTTLIYLQILGDVGGFMERVP